MVVVVNLPEAARLSRFNPRISHCVSQRREPSRSLLSDASKGREREFFIEQFLKRVFSPSFRFGSGDIIDSRGNSSGQIDIAIEQPFLPSLPTQLNDVRLYFAEGVAAVFEIKSNVCKQWTEVEETTQKVKRLEQHYIRTYGPGGSFSGNPIVKKIPVYAIGYRGYKTIRGLEQRLRNTDIGKRPDGVLVLESKIFTTQDCSYSDNESFYIFIVTINDLLNNLTLHAEVERSIYLTDNSAWFKLD